MFPSPSVAFTDLKALLRTKVLDALKGMNLSLRGSSLLVADETAAEVLADANCSINDLMNVGIREKQSLFANRNDPKDSVVYFVTPDPDVLKRIVDDTMKRKLYRTCHFLIAGDISDELFDSYLDQLRGCDVAAFVVLNGITFIPYESKVFLLGEVDSLSKLFGATSSDVLEGNIEDLAYKLLDVMTTMNLDPVIRCFDPKNQGRSLSARVGTHLRHLVDQFKETIARNNQNAIANGADPNSITEKFPIPTPYDHLGPPNVIIVDRAIDLISPLLHSLSFQAAVHDCFHVDVVDSVHGERNIVFKIDQEGKKDAVLDESSPLFNSIRHILYVQAIKEIQDGIQRVNEFTNSEATVEQLKEKLFTASEMAARVEELASFEILMRQLINEIEVVRNLLDAVVIEQDLATGSTVKGTALSRKNMFKKMKEVISFQEENIKPDFQPLKEHDRLRLLLVFALAFGQLQEPDFQELLRLAKIDEKGNAIFAGLNFFGVNPAEVAKSAAVATASGSSTWIPSMFAGIGGGKSKQSENVPVENREIDRYEPAVASVVHRFFNKGLGDEFSVVYGSLGRNSFNTKQTILRKARSSNAIPGASQADGADSVKIGEGVITSFSEFTAKWGKARPRAAGGADFRENGSKTLLIVLGGISFAEIRALYNVGIKEMRELFIGSTHILSAKDFTDAMIAFGTSNRMPLDLQSFENKWAYKEELAITQPVKPDFVTTSNPNIPATTVELPLRSTMSVPTLHITEDDELSQGASSISLSQPATNGLPNSDDADGSVTAADVLAVLAQLEDQKNAPSQNDQIRPNYATFESGAYNRPVTPQSDVKPAPVYQAPARIEETLADLATVPKTRLPDVITHEGISPFVPADTRPPIIASPVAAAGVSSYSAPKVAPPPAATVPSIGSSYAQQTPYGNKRYSYNSQQPQSLRGDSPGPSRASDSVRSATSVRSESGMYPQPPRSQLGRYQTSNASESESVASDVASNRQDSNPQEDDLLNRLLGISSARMTEDEKVDKVLNLFPGYSREVVRADIRLTGNAESTIERILSGLLPPDSAEPETVPSQYQSQPFPVREPPQSGYSYQEQQYRPPQTQTQPQPQPQPQPTQSYVPQYFPNQYGAAPGSPAMNNTYMHGSPPAQLYFPNQAAYASYSAPQYYSPMYAPQTGYPGPQQQQQPHQQIRQPQHQNNQYYPSGLVRQPQTQQPPVQARQHSQPQIDNFVLETTASRPVSQPPPPPPTRPPPSITPRIAEPSPASTAAQPRQSLPPQPTAQSIPFPSGSTRPSAPSASATSSSAPSAPIVVPSTSTSGADAGPLPGWKGEWPLLLTSQMSAYAAYAAKYNASKGRK